MKKTLLTYLAALLLLSFSFDVLAGKKSRAAAQARRDKALKTTRPEAKDVFFPRLIRLTLPIQEGIVEALGTCLDDCLANYTFYIGFTSGRKLSHTRYLDALDFYKRLLRTETDEHHVKNLELCDGLIEGYEFQQSISSEISMSVRKDPHTSFITSFMNETRYTTEEIELSKHMYLESCKKEFPTFYIEWLQQLRGFIVRYDVEQAKTGIIERSSTQPTRSLRRVLGADTEEKEPTSTASDKPEPDSHGAGASTDATCKDKDVPSTEEIDTLFLDAVPTCLMKTIEKKPIDLIVALQKAPKKSSHENPIAAFPFFIGFILGFENYRELFEAASILLVQLLSEYSETPSKTILKQLQLCDGIIEGYEYRLAQEGNGREGKVSANHKTISGDFKDGWSYASLNDDLQPNIPTSTQQLLLETYTEARIDSPNAQLNNLAFIRGYVTHLDLLKMQARTFTKRTKTILFCEKLAKRKTPSLELLLASPRGDATRARLRSKLTTSQDTKATDTSPESAKTPSSASSGSITPPNTSCCAGAGEGGESVRSERSSSDEEVPQAPSKIQEAGRAEGSIYFYEIHKQHPNLSTIAFKCAIFSAQCIIKTKIASSRTTTDLEYHRAFKEGFEMSHQTTQRASLQAFATLKLPEKYKLPA